MKILPVATELLYADRRTDMMTLIVDCAIFQTLLKTVGQQARQKTPRMNVTVIFNNLR